MTRLTGHKVKPIGNLIHSKWSLKIPKKGESKVLEFESQRKAQNLQGSQQFQNEGDAHSPRKHEKYSCYHLSKYSLILKQVLSNRF